MQLLKLMPKMNMGMLVLLGMWMLSMNMTAMLSMPTSRTYMSTSISTSSVTCDLPHVHNGHNQ